MSLGIFALNGFILSFILYFNKRGLKISNRILGLLLFVFSIILVEESLKLLEFHLERPRIVGFSFFMDMILGPLAYIYSLILTRKDFRFKPPTSVHLAIPIIINILYLPYHFLVEWDLHLLNNPNLGITLSWVIILKIVYQFVYQFISIRNVSRYLKTIDRDSISTSQYRAGVLFKNVMTAVIILIPVVLLFDQFQEIFVIDSDYLTSLIMLMGIYSIGYGALTNPWFYTRELDKKAFKAEFISPPAKPKYNTSSLTEAEKLKHKNQILDYMQKEKPYLNPDMTFDNLIAGVKLPRHQLSQILNEELNQNFYDFINSYRVKAIIEKIENQEYPQKNILELGLESGFNSKPTLNRAFKKVTGGSPLAYIRKVQSLN